MVSEAVTQGRALLKNFFVGGKRIGKRFPEFKFNAAPPVIHLQRRAMNGYLTVLHSQVKRHGVAAKISISRRSSLKMLRYFSEKKVWPLSSSVTTGSPAKVMSAPVQTRLKLMLPRRLHWRPISLSARKKRWSSAGSGG